MRLSIFGIALYSFAMLAPGAVLAQAGYVHAVTGTATIADANGVARPARTGDLINQGATLNTAPNSTAVIKFEDGQVMALRERTGFRVADYSYNKTNISNSRAVFNLLAGGFRFITGVIGATNPNSFRIIGGTATIGIRGTDGYVDYDPVTQAVTAAVNAGAVVFSTPLGTQTIPANSFVSASPNSPPTTPASIISSSSLVGRNGVYSSWSVT